MSTFPTELWQIICHYLSSDELACLRLVNRTLADVAAETLITEIRFDTSHESFERLQAVANHNLLCKGVKKLVYEGGMIEDAGCIHHYSHHYDALHPTLGKPLPPQDNEKSTRADRLHARNLAKFEKTMQERYREYRTLYEAQQNLAETANQYLSCIARLRNLDEVNLKTDTPCVHQVSPVFRKKYYQDCAVKISLDTASSVWQLENLLHKTGLTRLSARQLSPEFFDGNGIRSKPWLASRFSKMERIQLMFRPDFDSTVADADASIPIGSLTLKAASLLAYSLGTATNLQSLTVNFHPVIEETAGQLIHIMAGTSFASLTHLDLDFFSTTEDYFVQMLKRQPKLSGLYIAFAVLTEGRWANTIKRMRYELSLEEFFCNGQLEDPEMMFSLDLCERDMWRDGDKHTLSSAIDLYVTDSNYPVDEDDFDMEDPDVDFDIVWNPIYRIDEDFDSEEDLTLDLGPISDDDEKHGSDSSGSDSDEENDSDDEDEDLPALMDID
ncbi:hypothetical protein LTR05_006438 [Lithohypha guttulata]|uniref:F-box domain-containing protein n=1 Tax=Lithohypha guttulata TaxID=1690604 RepID=A0AAN7SX92_9EURO|nr:hypothetical protein LTR05_006438 [Lithohypha guttulata]